MSKRGGDAMARSVDRQIDAIAFIEGTLINPQTGKLFVLTRAEKRFLRHAFELTPDGRMRHPELMFSAPKKTGKTAFAAMMVIYTVCVLGGPFAEGICVANDFEQAQGRVFQAISRIVEASPLLARDAMINAGKIEFASTSSTIIAIASDYAGAAGSNPTIVCFDELWGYVSERSHRLWDELVPPPTRKLACRLTVTYAGYEGESTLLEGLHKRGLKGKEIAPDLYQQSNMLMFWTYRHTSPWQTAEWREQMRDQLRPNAYLRLIENRWVSSDSTFVDMEWWDKCVTADAAPLFADRQLSVWCGVDASVKRDSTAIVACTWDAAAKKARLIWHRIFQPTAAEPLDFEATVEATLLELRRRFRLREVRYDPYQMQAVAQRLHRAGVPMVEFPQSVPNLTEASTNLYELIKSGNLIAYADAGIRLAIQRSIAIETSCGWRIAKEKTSHKIDVVIALGMAAHAAAVQGHASAPLIVSWKQVDQIRNAPANRPYFRERQLFRRF